MGPCTDFANVGPTIGSDGLYVSHRAHRAHLDAFLLRTGSRMDEWMERSL